jgi:hypothetical protein
MIEVIPKITNESAAAFISVAKSTTSGAMMPPTRAEDEFAPRAAFRTTVGNSSMV